MNDWKEKAEFNHVQNIIGSGYSFMILMWNMTSKLKHKNASNHDGKNKADNLLLTKM